MKAIRLAVALATSLPALLFSTQLHGAASPPGDPANTRMAGLPAGYLKPEQRLDSVRLVPPPPRPASMAEARDREVAARSLSLRAGERWALATKDAELRLPAAADTFSCALGVQLSSVEAPRLMSLLARTMGDLGHSPAAAKDKFKRPRPFMVNGAPTCTPSHEVHLRQNGSYPSGHSAIGWGWGLILAQLAPDRAEAILARARAFGHSRVICNVHWLSDVEEGRLIASATVARLQAEPEFRSHLAAAREELARVLRSKTPRSDSCPTEAAVLAGGW